MISIVGETAVCTIVVTNVAGTQVDPATSMTITIRGPSKKVLVDKIGMSHDDTGEYHYDYTITDGPGKYKVLYVATNGSRISKAKDEFNIADESD